MRDDPFDISSDGRITARELRAMAAGLDRRVAETTRSFGALLQTRVRARASGRPGPRRQTGDYRRSIALETHSSDGVHTATVGTNAPQGRRLEYGFVGADALNRTFNQPPYPHFGPALDETEPEYVRALGTVIDEAARAARGGPS